MNNNAQSVTMDFDLQPTLKGTLIDVRPLRSEDFEALFAAASDPLIWEQHPERDRYKREVFQTFFDGAVASKGALAVIKRASGRIIGCSRYCNLNIAEREVEIGFTFLERQFWGGRYNSELKKLMMDHAFRFVDSVVFVVGETNLRSQRALQKIGATIVGERKLPSRDGSPIPCVVFRIKAGASTR
jgi:N-acetyltransferase